MCFICQNTGIILIKNNENLRTKDINLKEIVFSCPICGDFALAELDEIIKNEGWNNKSIHRITMNQECYTELANLCEMPMKCNVNPPTLLSGIPIEIDNNVKKWKVEYK